MCPGGSPCRNPRAGAAAVIEPAFRVVLWSREAAYADEPAGTRAFSEKAGATREEDHGEDRGFCPRLQRRLLLRPGERVAREEYFTTDPVVIVVAIRGVAFPFYM